MTLGSGEKIKMWPSDYPLPHPSSSLIFCSIKFCNSCQLLGKQVHLFSSFIYTIAPLHLWSNCNVSLFTAGTCFWVLYLVVCPLKRERRRLCLLLVPPIETPFLARSIQLQLGVHFCECNSLARRLTKKDNFRNCFLACDFWLKFRWSRFLKSRKCMVKSQI